MYSKGSLLNGVEKQVVSTAPKKMMHKETKIFIHNSLKEDLFELCNENGLTRAE
jgi:hypothetical protein